MLYAGGPQDAWDSLRLLTVPGQAALVEGVDRSLDALPPACRSFWNRLRPA